MNKQYTQREYLISHIKLTHKNSHHTHARTHKQARFEWWNAELLPAPKKEPCAKRRKRILFWLHRNAAQHSRHFPIFAITDPKMPFEFQFKDSMSYTRNYSQLTYNPVYNFNRFSHCVFSRCFDSFTIIVCVSPAIYCHSDYWYGSIQFIRSKVDILFFSFFFALTLAAIFVFSLSLSLTHSVSLSIARSVCIIQLYWTTLFSVSCDSMIRFYLFFLFSVHSRSSLAWIFYAALCTILYNVEFIGVTVLLLIVESVCWQPRAVGLSFVVLVLRFYVLCASPCSVWSLHLFARSHWVCDLVVFIFVVVVCMLFAESFQSG